MHKINIKAYFAWIAICIIWGTTYLAIRVGVTDLPPMLFAGLRWIIAGTILISYLKFKGHKLPGKNELFPVAVVGLALIGFGNGLVVVGEQWVNSGLTALLITTTPFWMVGIESLLPQGNRINGFTIWGLILCLSGVFLIFGNHFEDLLNASYLIGIISILGAVIAWASGSVYSKYKKTSIHPLVAASVQMLIAGSAQVLLGLILGEFSSFELTQNGFLSLAYLTVVGSIFGYGSYIYSIAHLPLSLVSTYAYINPIIALILGWLILNERLDFMVGISAIIIIAGVVLVQQGSQKK
jgi:drug/metabolite transporter (DMT)-like permease